MNHYLSFKEWTAELVRIILCDSETKMRSLKVAKIHGSILAKLEVHPDLVNYAWNKGSTIRCPKIQSQIII